MRLLMMLKRDMRLFLRGFGPAVLLTCLLGIACVFAGMAAQSGAQRHTEPVRVALVDTEDSLLSRISINMVTDQSYMSSLMEINQEDSADEALDKMADGTYGAVVVLPDGYMEKIMHGEKCTGKIYISDALENEGELIEAIADFGSRLLSAGQLGVFAGERVIAEQGLPEEVHSSFLENSNAGLITFALDAYDTVFCFEVVPYGDTGISMVMYYIACWLVMLLLVTGLFFPDLYISDCKGSIYSRLKTCGITRVDFMLGKVLYPALFRILFVIIAVLASAKLFPEFFENSSLSHVQLILILSVVCLFISIITGNLAVALSKKGGWTVTILAVSAVCLFMAGGLVPRTMLPEILPKLAVYTPFGSALALVIHAAGGKLGGFAAPDYTVIQAAAVCLIYAVVAIAAAMSTLRRIPRSDEEVRL